MKKTLCITLLLLATLGLQAAKVPAAAMGRLQMTMERQMTALGLKPALTFSIDASMPEGSYEIGANGRVKAADVPACFAAVGKYIEMCPDMAPGRKQAYRGPMVKVKPAKPFRCVYFATHFGNFYDEAPIDRICDYVDDLATMGCNTLVVWLDIHTFESINDPKAQEKAARLRAILSHATRLGMSCGLTSLANEGYRSTPQHLRAHCKLENGYFMRPDDHYGCEVCPSTQEGMELILKNKREVLEQFKDCNVRYCIYWPYDQGGCTCEHCAPWGTNGFMKLYQPHRKLFNEFFPGLKIIFSTWYFDRHIKGEYEGFARELNNGTFGDDYIMMFSGHAGYPEALRRQGVPKGTVFVDFPEISMHYAIPWGGYGANPYPAFLQQSEDSHEVEFSGGMCYSEGIFDDINKFAMMSLYTGSAATTREAVKEYCRRWFACTDEPLVKALCDMETTLERKAKKEVPNLLHQELVPAIWQTIASYNDRLPAAVAKDFRWRIIYLRAKLDNLLIQPGARLNDEGEISDCFTELRRIYHWTYTNIKSCCTPGFIWPR